MYRQRKSRFRPKEMKALDQLKKPNETEREFVLRLAGIDAEPIPRGYNSQIRKIAIDAEKEYRAFQKAGTEANLKFHEDNLRVYNNRGLSADAESRARARARATSL